MPSLLNNHHKEAKMRLSLLFKLLLTSLIVITTPIYAYDEPAVNLGYTSFYDGSPPAGIGAYFQNYFQYYTASRLNDNRGNSLPFPRNDLQVTAEILQLIYLSSFKIGQANLGISALIPTVVSARVRDGLPQHQLKAQEGFGDLFIGPALQFTPVMRRDGHSPLFVQRIEFDVVAPVGRSNPEYSINPSSHFWSINPYWAATFWFTPQWSTAVRLHYLWNAENTTPNLSFGPNIRSTQAGQAIFGNFALGYAFKPTFTVGLNGYFFDQISDTRVNGHPVPNRDEHVWAVGPGMVSGLSANIFMFFNLYFEQNAYNRPQGVNGIWRFVAHLS